MDELVNLVLDFQNKGNMLKQEDTYPKEGRDFIDTKKQTQENMKGF